jgi:hypothetical protein
MADLNILDYIVKDAYILVPVLYVIGLFLKKIPALADWIIPWILLGLGLVGGFFLSDMNPKGLLQGVLVAGAAVFANQLYKQTVIKSKGDMDEGLVDDTADAGEEPEPEEPAGNPTDDSDQSLG